MGDWSQSQSGCFGDNLSTGAGAAILLSRFKLEPSEKKTLR